MNVEMMMNGPKGLAFRSFYLNTSRLMTEKPPASTAPKHITIWPLGFIIINQNQTKPRMITDKYYRDSIIESKEEYEGLKFHSEALDLHIQSCDMYSDA